MKNLHPLQIVRQKPIFLVGVILILLAVLVGGYFYWMDLQSKVYIEKSELWAPIITLAPKNMGEIEMVYVKEGDVVVPGQQLVRAGGQIISAKTNGIITWVGNTPGQLANSQTPVVKMYDPQSLRVVGHIQEDKGLKDIHVGQKVIFTVDAFGDRSYYGVVETIATSARQSSIVFTISDKREEKEFDVTASFDVNAYPELKNGMSAKMWVIK